jgi:hypothetical protein
MLISGSSVIEAAGQGLGRTPTHLLIILDMDRDQQNNRQRQLNRDNRDEGGAAAPSSNKMSSLCCGSMEGR